MTTHSRRGMLAGAFAGGVAAIGNWEGNVIVAASSVIVGTAIGWAIGYFLGKRKPVPEKTK